MAWFKRIFLFLATNILIMLSLSIIIHLFGLDRYLVYGEGQGLGLDYETLLIFCAVWGMGGAFISLLLSKVIAKYAMGVKIIDPQTADGNAREVLNVVHRLAKSAGISRMPEVGIYNSPEVNAFATGPTKNRSLVAVSSGLLQRMNKDQVEGVLGHEVAHISNGDMVTMTLVQGVVNAFVMFFARVLAFAISSASRNDDRGSAGMSYMLVFLFEILFGFLGMIVVGYYSRQREFRADSGGATLAGRPKMIAALEGLRSGIVDPSHPSLATLKISSGKPKGFLALLSTHPSLEERIQRLKTMAY